MLSQHNISTLLKYLKLHFSQNKMLLLAVIASLILHLLLFTNISFYLPDIDLERQILDMRLVNLQPAKKTDTVIKNSIPSPPTQPLKQETPSLPVSKDATIEPQSNIQDSPVTTEQEPVETAPSQATESTAPTSEENLDTTTPKSKIYNYVETEFEVRRGNDISAAGITVITFNRLNESAYSITSTTEAKGLASLIFDKLRQNSEGTITESGLRPSRYLYQYGNDDRKAQIATFAWSDGIVEMRNAKGIKEENIAEGTQDFLSFMYQFMFVPPLENTQITMTNGKNLRTYTYSFQGEELIQTKFKAINTIHLLKQGDEEEKTELWLAIDYRYDFLIRRELDSGGLLRMRSGKRHRGLLTC